LKKTDLKLESSVLGLDRYQYSVSVSGRYQWYRYGIGIADTAADTRTDAGGPVQSRFAETRIAES